MGHGGPGGDLGPAWALCDCIRMSPSEEHVWGAAVGDCSEPCTCTHSCRPGRDSGDGSSVLLSRCQCSSVAQSRLTLCDPMDCSTPGLPVHHQLPELAQIHVHQVSDASQPSHPVIPFSSCLQSFSPSGSFPMNQFFTSGGQSIGVSASASVLPVNTQA